MMPAIQSDSRLLSLDAFRGITIAGMILVNNPGSWQYVYPPLRHAEWHGWTPTDFIFPFFLFIVGVAMTFSFAKRIEVGDSGRRVLLHVMRRALILFALGMLLNLYWRSDFATVRIPGVLQRIALCYLFASVVVLSLRLRWQVVLAAVLLVGYWMALALVRVPGYGAGCLDPQGNLCWYIDSMLLAGHTWSGAPVAGFDPEGILSTIPAVVTTLLGVFTGYWLRSERAPSEKVTGMFVAANGCLILGVVLGIWLPINKNLWTSSYVVFMAGMALHFLALCYWLVDIRQYRKWAHVFIVYGSNAIVAFVTLSLFGKTLALWRVHQAGGGAASLKSIVYHRVLAPWAGDNFGSLLFPVAMLIIWYGLLLVLYKKKIFVKI
jgi:predicted acyltransferase